jgi:predicted dehydrogenase
MNAPPPPLRWGILGTGGIAGAFADDLALTDSGVVSAVGSRTRAGAESFGRAHGIERRHASYHALVDDPTVEAVYVATPHPFHLPNALLALAAGRHVLVEKPFTMDVDEARSLVAAARDAGRFVMEAMWTRFLPHMVEIRRLLGQGVLGELVAVEADHGQWFPADPSHRLFAPELGGGALLDLGVYPVSFSSMVLGTPDRVEALSTPAMTGVDGTTSILLGHPHGAHAVLTCTSRARTPTRAVVTGTEGRIEIAGFFFGPSRFRVVPRAGDPWVWDLPHHGRGLRHQADEVARCLAEGRAESSVLPLDESVSVMATLDAVRAAADAAP